MRGGKGKSDSQNLGVNEPPTGIGSGVLGAIWVEKKKLPTIAGAERTLYYLTRGVRTLLAIPANNIVSVISIGISLFLFAGFLLLLQNIDRVVSGAGNSVVVSVYFRQGSSADSIEDFLYKLRNNAAVRNFDYISKEEGLELLREEMGSQSGFLSGLQEDNPLPHSVDINVYPDELGTDRVARFLDSLRVDPIVEELIDGSEWIQRARGMLRVFRLIALVALFVSLAVVTLLISNTIRLVMYSRREEIEIMKLVGASDSFIVIPFVIGGLLQGLLGSILGLFLLRFGYVLLNNQLRGSQVFGVTFAKLSFLSLPSLIGIVVLGIVVGAIGSFISLRKFIKV